MLYKHIMKTIEKKTDLIVKTIFYDNIIWLLRKYNYSILLDSQSSVCELYFNYYQTIKILFTMYNVVQLLMVPSLISIINYTFIMLMSLEQAPFSRD